LSEDVAQGVRVLAGRYELGAQIGHGGMSDVFLGTDTRLGRTVAIKLLRASLAEDPSFRARFRREAQDAAKMAHPTIVRIFDAGEEAVRTPEGEERLVPFIVMEHVDGRLLRDIIAEGAVSQAQAAKVIEQVLIALEYSHRAGVIHRDIKPGNIMVTRSGQVKVMDFGIARAISETASSIAETSQVVGTAQYFSPEQARGEVVDARTDLYSTGIVLFELLTGRAPFAGDNPVAVAYQHINAEPPVPSRVNPAISPAMDLVVLKAIAKDPGRRYQSAAEFRADLATAAAGQLPVKHAPRPDEFAETLFGSQAAASQAAARQLSTDVDDRSLRTQSGPPVLWIWAGIIALLAIIAAVIYWIFTLQPPRITDDLVRQVPDVVGMSIEEGRASLDDAGFLIEEQAASSDTVPSGTILRTEPGAGVSLERGKTIQVTVSSGQSRVDIPDVSRQSVEDASAALTAAGFVIGEIRPTNSADIPKDAVITTDPGPGENAAFPGTTINLVISNGVVSVPDFTNVPLAEARTSISQLGLVLKTTIVPTCTGGAVQTQSIVGDQPQHSTIDITVCAP